MEGCFLQDVFPDWKRPDGKRPDDKSPDGKKEGTSPSEKARKEQKKRAKRCKDPALRYLESDSEFNDLALKDPGDDPRADPDRLFLRPQGSLKEELNKETGVVETKHVVPGAERVSIKRPSYFGASEEDDMTEGFAPFTNIIGDDPAYRFSSELVGTEKEVATIMDMSKEATLLPSPSLDDVWKPLTPAGVQTAFFKGLPPPGGIYPKQELAGRGGHTSSLDELKEKMNHIFGRLDALESERRQHAQTEVLLFVGSGLALLLSLDIISRP